MPDSLSTPLQSFAVDVGGTFTDCVSLAAPFPTHKLLSTGNYQAKIATADGKQVCLATKIPFPAGFLRGGKLKVGNKTSTISASSDGTLTIEDPVWFEGGSLCQIVTGLPAPVVGLKFLTGTPLADALPPCQLRLGTTIGTNALLERKGSRVCYITTEGFEDLLLIGTQERPSLFELNIKKGRPIYDNVIPVKERLTRLGEVITPCDLRDLKPKLEEVRRAGIDTCAICLLNAYVNDEHERQVAALCKELGFTSIVRSTLASPGPKMLERADTALLDAYLAAPLKSYLTRLQDELALSEILVMTSTGNLVRPETFTGKDSVLSGPAGGVVALARLCDEEQIPQAIGFDMGGTSTDVARYDGEVERRFEWLLQDETTRTDLRVSSPSLAIDTVAAGGGSICWFDGSGLRVGPQSAGADPGPSSYGQGGPLTITDCNVFLGRVASERFPFELDTQGVVARVDELVEAIRIETGIAYSREDLASGFLAIAVSNMAAPIRKLSLARGYDIREHSLVSFGGAGPQHVCALATELGIDRIVHDPRASVFSAAGIGMAKEGLSETIPIQRPYDAAVMKEVSDRSRQAQERLAKTLATQSVRSQELVQLRYAGQENTLSVRLENDLPQAFAALHEERYGFTLAKPLEVVSLLVVVEDAEHQAFSRQEMMNATESAEAYACTMYMDGKWQSLNCLTRSAMAEDQLVAGPAVITESDTILIIESGFTARKTTSGRIVLQRTSSKRVADLTHGQVDPMSLTLFANQFISIAEQMGERLRAAALSVNIRERLDYSCAIFDGEGHLVVNAPHVPVHLGAMGDTVRRFMRDLFPIKRHTVYITNDPFAGGSHLPDVTVMEPVFLATENRAAFFVAARAHHAEIGGKVPGSMPAGSKTLSEEGVLIPLTAVARADLSATAEALFVDGDYPSRAPEINAADLKAQAAATNHGAKSLQKLCALSGRAAVTKYMQELQTAAANRLSRALERLPPGPFTRRDSMDDGSVLQVKIDLSHPGIIFDFKGSSPQAFSNLNAPAAIARAAIFYCLRVLIGEDMPLNEGLLAKVELRLPPGSLINPRRNDDGSLPAVAGGNVETSQRIVDVILGALGLCSASQGTMNNLAFGSKTSPSYYETIGGGAGAGPDFPGASGVQCHMTNTRITDPEVLEARYPVRLKRFSLRPNSGGEGLQNGGDGLIREFEFLSEQTVSLLTSRRHFAPFGLHGGADGKKGTNFLIRSHGVVEELGATSTIEVAPHDILRIETPGGGGYGKALRL